MSDKAPTPLVPSWNLTPQQDEIACDLASSDIMESETYHVQRKHGVKLDQAVKITEENRDRQQKEIHRVSDIVAQQLDEFRHEYPTHEENKAQSLRVVVPGSRAFEKEK